ncbi:MAG: TIGR04013 family B12-binding domain/radical SAM domain-containing protein [Elusimicrobia bacterium]|nr:TIGR04013 family B12-binding domain/radical SAM domain-containing protein [Candidatus Liberimonas magnetica]
MAKKLNIIFRWSNYNHYTLSALIGLVDEKLDPRKFYISTKESAKDIINEVNSNKSINILCYSFMVTEFESVKNEIRELKNVLKDKIIIICGGSFTTAVPKAALGAGADIAFRGETEESFPDFLNKLYDSGKLPENRIIDPLPLKNFDDYPPFAYKRGFFGPIELRRGCLNRCTFCQTPQIFPKIRERSIEYAKHYNKYLIEAKRDRVSFIISDALSYGAKGGRVNLKYLEDFLSGIRKTKINIMYGNFPSEISSHSLALYPEAAGILRKYIQNRKIIIGAQSGSDNVLKIMKRKDTKKDVLESVKILSANGFIPIVDILFGVPEETKKDRIQTLEFMKSLLLLYKNIQFNLHYFIPLPGTVFANTAPEPIEDDIKEEIVKFVKIGVVLGDFFRQVEFGRKLA